jgi:hypothetical protein
MKVTCHDFEALWHARLDARDAAPAAVERALEDHAAACPACAAIGARYRTLAVALQAWGAPPSAPEGLAARIVAAYEVERCRAVRLPARSVWPWAVSAAVLVAGVFGLRWARQPRDDGAPVVAVKASPRPLTLALADATLATLDLARETSAPAARVGRQMLASVAAEGEGPALVLPTAPEPPADVLQSVGEGVNQGVRPLSGSARHAFGFLLGPAPVVKPRPAPARDRDV